MYDNDCRYSGPASGSQFTCKGPVWKRGNSNSFLKARIIMGSEKFYIADEITYYTESTTLNLLALHFFSNIVFYIYFGIVFYHASKKFPRLILRLRETS